MAVSAVLFPTSSISFRDSRKAWTDTGMTDGHRAFCMGNALVTGVPHRIGEAMVEVYGL